MALQNLNEKGQLSNSAGALLTSGTNESWIIQKITLANASGSAVSDIKLFIYASGGSAGNANQVHYIGSLADDDQVTVSLSNHVLRNGDVLAGVAGTNAAVNYVISYARRTG